MPDLRAGPTLLRPALGAGEVELWHFELKTDLAPGGTADAWPRTWNADTSEWETDDEADYEPVYDALGKHRSFGRDSYPEPESESDPDPEGAIGIAYMAESGRYEILNIQTVAQRIKGSTADAVETDTDPFTIDGVTSSDGGQIPPLTGDAHDQVSVANWAGWDANEDTPCSAHWNEELGANGGYEFEQGSCRPIVVEE